MNSLARKFKVYTETSKKLNPSGNPWLGKGRLIVRSLTQWSIYWALVGLVIERHKRNCTT